MHPAEESRGLRSWLAALQQDNRPGDQIAAPFEGEPDRLPALRAEVVEPIRSQVLTSFFSREGSSNGTTRNFHVSAIAFLLENIEASYLMCGGSGASATVSSLTSRERGCPTVFEAVRR
jgi:hypothetical protein